MSAVALDQDGEKFLLKSAKTGLKEVHLSRLAVERAELPEVRTFAQTLLNDHQRANAELATLANRKGIMLPLDTASASLRMEGDAEVRSAEHAATAGADRATTTAPTGGRIPSGGGAPAARDADARGAVTVGGGSTDLSELMEDVQKAANKLSRKSGEDFDRAYINEMVDGHEKSIDRFEEQAASTADSELARFARTHLPLLREHLARAQALKQELRN